MDRVSLTRPARTALLTVLLAGCSCDAPEAVTTRAPETVEVEPPRATLPSASRTDLPAVTPMLTVEITDDEFHLSNTALIATWPAREREALLRGQPAGDARWPEVEAQIRAHGDDISIPALREAFAHAANVDHARAALAGDVGAPIAFAIRAGPDVRFVRVLQAIYAAGLAGYAEPRLVLLSSTTEAALPLPLPRGPSARDSFVARDLAAALAAAGIEGSVRPSEEAAPPTAPTPDLTVELREDGLHITSGGQPLAPGCAEPAESDVVTIAAADLAPSRLTTCADAAGAASALTFRASPDARYADAVAVLEILAARGPVGLAVAR